MTNRHRFTYSAAQLQEFAAAVVGHAKRLGASACECDVSEGRGLSVTVRKGAVETIEHNRDKALGITVFFGHKKGSASTTDFSSKSVQECQ